MFSSTEYPQKWHITTVTIENTFTAENMIAGKANFFDAFATPQNNAVNDTNSKNGKVIRPKVTAISNCSFEDLNPDAMMYKKFGYNIIIKMQNIDTKTSISEKTFDKSVLASSILFVSNTLENLGKNDALNAPSAKILRHVFASLTATKKQSKAALTPRNAVNKHSLIKPKILLKNVKTLTVIADLMTLISSLPI